MLIIVNVLHQDPIIGGSLLLTYTTGYVAPLLVAASFAGALQVNNRYGNPSFFHVSTGYSLFDKLIYLHI